MKTAEALIVGAYFVVGVSLVPYYNWQYARDYGFLNWFLLGEIIPTRKALVWPYFVFLGERGGSSSAVKIVEFTDNVYNLLSSTPQTGSPCNYQRRGRQVRRELPYKARRSEAK